MSHETVIVDALPKCDFCSIHRAQYDGRTIQGAWANMCYLHFTMYGIGLGLGKGQRLVVLEKAETTE